jgi:GTP-binding protein Era
MEPRANDRPTRAGYVALIGRPNAGKSSLLNRILGEHLSIVTSKAQTTRRRVTGIHSDATTQLIFLDTPGILAPRNLLQHAMVGAARLALEEADVVLLLLDATAETPETLAHVDSLIAETRVPLVVAVNKVDVAEADAVARLLEWGRERTAIEPLVMSATEGTGVDELVPMLKGLLPEGPFLYPEDELSTETLRFFAEELVRETIFDRYRDEVPYAVAVQVEDFREKETPVYIQANVFVERNTQKQIVIGKGGQAIRDVGKEARMKIERLLGRRVYLDLWVKVLPNWRRRRSALGRLGYRLPTREEYGPAT